MTQNRHTPGPWRIGKSGGSVVTDNEIEDAVGGSWGEDAKTFYGGNLIAESITPANARLIAAAPDLLEALRELISLIDAHLDGAYEFDSFTTQPGIQAILAIALNGEFDDQPET
jgi:hypothetical protein